MTRTLSGETIIHASCVRWLDKGLLITGASGSGKSDLALRLIDAGAQLIADDLVAVRKYEDALHAAPLKQGQGLIEMRGQGVFCLPFGRMTRLDLSIRLKAADQLERLPMARDHHLLQTNLPAIDLDPSQPSAVARLRVFLTASRLAPEGT